MPKKKTASGQTKPEEAAAEQVPTQTEEAKVDETVSNAKLSQQPV